MLRSFDLSIEDIRRIFNNEISLNTCLNQKKEYLLKEIGKKQRIIDLIEKTYHARKLFRLFKNSSRH